MSGVQTKNKIPEVIVYIAMSLDGFIATKDNGLSWLNVVKTEGEDYGYSEFMKSIDVILMGRNTYDAVRGFGEWPFEGKKVLVFTHRPFDPIKDEKPTSGRLSDILEKIGSSGAQRVYLDGGQLIRTGLIEGVINRIIISVIPVLLGDGIPLFGSFGSQVKLECLSANRFTSGLVQLNYKVV